ncbi:ESCRT-II complex, vps25 subunit [Hypoxylon sp. FL1284]|nr:ESCRT-II complex, vps25 subunit [Hypoxylon sp. FL1284]
MSLTPASSSSSAVFATPTSPSSSSRASQAQPTPTTTPAATRGVAATTTTGPGPTSSAAPPPAFEFPREYHFPPFFTRQTNAATLHSQLDKWASLVAAYCRHHRLFRLSLSPAGVFGDGGAHEALFRNRRVARRLAPADAREVLDFMRRDGRAEPLDADTSATSFYYGALGRDDSDAAGAGDIWWIYWRTPEEWAGLVEAWVDETAQKGTVLTLYELTEGEDTRGTEFHGLDPDLLLKALQVLVKRGKAQIFGQEDQQGVKFF